MSSGGLINVAGVRELLTIPAYIFGDTRASLAAKGIFAQICYSKDNILALSDISTLANDSEETVINCINELVDLGYLVKDKKGNFSLRHKALSSKTVSKKEDSAEIKSTIQDTVIEPTAKKNKFEFVKDRVEDSDFPDSVKKLLVDYFYKWLKGEDRFADQELHKNMVDGRIESLTKLKNTFSLSQSEMEQCVKQSIDNHWRKFIWPLVQKSNSFNRASLVSGSYTKEEIEEIKRKAQQRLEESSDE